MATLTRISSLFLIGALVWALLPGWAEEIAPPEKATQESVQPDSGQPASGADTQAVAPAPEPSAEEKAVKNVLSSRLMNGYPDGQFHPEGQLTRAQLASIINKTFRVSERSIPPEVALRDPQMPSDVPPAHWAYDDVRTVLKHGVMQGYREGYFHPDHPVSRAEALAIFAQAYGVYQYNDATVQDILAEYPDAPQVPEWAKKAMATALRQGFVNARPGEAIRPLQPMTRGDMAYALNEYLVRLYETEKPALPQE